MIQLKPHEKEWVIEFERLLIHYNTKACNKPDFKDCTDCIRFDIMLSILGGELDKTDIGTIHAALELYNEFQELKNL